MKFKFSPNDLVSFRKEMGWTNKELAYKFGVGIRTIYYWISGRREMPGTAIRLVQLYRLLKAKGLEKYIEKF